MSEAISTLHYAVRPAVITRYLGQLALMLAVLILAPLLVSLFFHEYFLSWRYLIVVAVLTILGLLSRKIPSSRDIQDNEALMLTALAFSITPLIMSFPLMGSGLSFIDAWFEAVSAITTTGLTTVQHLPQKPHTFLFGRAWMQWYGGLGIVVLSVALLMGHQFALKRLIAVESENIMTTARVYAQRMLYVYSTLTFLGVLILWWLLGDFFNALNHVLAAVSTGGFSTMDNSLAGLPGWPARYTVILLGLLGSFPLVIYYRLMKGNWRLVLHDPEIKVLLFVALIVCVLLSIDVKFDLHFPWRDALEHGFLLGLSAQTTSGFTSLDVNQLSTSSLIILIVAMSIGGASGSTAGGIKILRFIILFRFLQLLFQRTALPSHAIVNPHIGDKALENEDISRALALIILYGLVIFLSWVVFLLYDYPPVQALFEVASATGTVGLSCGITTATMPTLLKLVLGFDMLLGRLEIVALLIVFYPLNWLGKRRE